MSESVDTNWRELIDEAELAWRAGDAHAALQFCDRAASVSEDARYLAATVRGNVLLSIGDADGALSSFDSVADPAVADPQLDCLRGVALFEQGRLPEAESALRSVLRSNPNWAEAHFILALIAEITENDQAVEHYRRARRLDPDRFPASLQFTRSEFERAVAKAIEGLPEPVLAVAQNIPILISAVPSLSDLQEISPRLSPRCGGVLVAEKPMAQATQDPSPVTLLLFKRNLERNCKTIAAVTNQIRLICLHEIGRAMGLSEDELDRLEIAQGL